jgi:lipid-A-disaccharide synthase
MRPLRIAIVAGESSGDLLGADLIAAVKTQSGRKVELFGVGGPALTREGLTSVFEFSEISIMGFVAVIKKLPRLLSLIRKTADAIIAAKPDVLVIVDSPDFTHRVAKRVRKALPDLPVVDYVCPSVWAWKEYRAAAMRAYVDHVLAVLPFEPEVMRRLDGPQTSYIGHRLRYLPDVLAARAANEARWANGEPERKTVLLLPGSRSHEVKRLLPIFGETARQMRAAHPETRFVIATVPHKEDMVRSIIADWEDKPEIFVGEERKWAAFSSADVALAASGTVLLELALCGIPTISTYKTDVLIRLVLNRIKVWSAALPNLIADRPVIPEYFDEFIRPAMLMRSLAQLMRGSEDRKAMLVGFREVFDRMTAPRLPAEVGAEIVIAKISEKLKY